MDKHAGERSLFETSLGKVCQEGLACEQGAGADYFCADCTTYQCTKCETLLHSTRELKAHIRNSLHVEQPRTTSRGRESATTKSSSTYTTSFPLVNEHEELMVSDKAEFVRRLGCSSDCKVKVVSIFGNTGDGKSYTLNHTFFDGEEVFSTSPSQSSCTIGVWTAYSPKYGAIFIDSEGLLGVSKNEHRRTRLLLKVLAVSDVVIYRTRAERLHNDLFTFLGDASNTYWKYFSPELKAASDRCSLEVPVSSLGPSVVIFHETLYTELLGEHARVNLEPTKWRESSSPDKKAAILDVSDEEDADDCPPLFFSTDEDQSDQEREQQRRPPQQMTAEELLRIRFSELGYIPKAFSCVEYVGTRTQAPPTDFSGLCAAVKGLIDNNAIRSPRRPQVVHTALKVLNDKFSGNISNIKVSTFPDAYFSCPEKCLSCGVRCDMSMNHLKDGVPHQISGARCKYNHTFDNKIYLCKSCFDRGVESVVTSETSASGESGWMGLAKYAWAGYVIECPHCGVIYRSRQHWYGNKDPEAAAVKTDNKHVWPQDLPASGPGSENMVRRLLDRVGSVADAVGSVSAQPAKSISSWMSDQIAPKYWTPNSKILSCGECRKEFGGSETKHHCRACGGGFCEKCSSKYMAVPWRGWGNVPVRVCLSCHKQAQGSHSQHRQKTHHGEKPTSSSQTTEKAEDKVTARYMGEVMQSALGLVAGAMSYPKDFIVESARPDYWVPDSKIKNCRKCKSEFGPTDSKHHCRACGEGFCGKCSTHQSPVPSRGWDYPVRVCDLCVTRTDM